MMEQPPSRYVSSDAGKALPEFTLTDHILFLQDSNEALQLSDAQAEQLYYALQTKDRLYGSAPALDYLHPLSDAALFSTEVLDHDLAIYAQILDREQLHIYQDYYRQNLRNHFDWVRKQDEEQVSRIHHTEKQLAYINETLIPVLEAAGPFRMISAPDFHETRRFLQSEYRLLCDQLHLKQLRDHFREHRDLAPNGFRLRQLEDERMRLLPDVDLIKSHFRAPVLELATGLVSRSSPHILPQAAAAITAAFEAFVAFNAAEFEAVLAEKPKGSVFLVNRSVDPAALYDGRLLSVLLQLPVA